jgi:hypothetical protein
MLGASLWEMVRHSKIPAQTFAKMMLSILDKNKDLAVLQTGLQQLLEVSDHYISRSIKGSYDIQLETWVKHYFDRVEGNNPAKILLFSAFLSIAQGSEAQTRIQGWLNKDKLAPHFEMDQERRWAVISFLSKRGAPEAAELIRTESKKDLNDKGQLSAMIAQVLSPSEENKKLWWGRLLGKDPTFPKLSVQDARRVMIAFHHLDQPELTEFATESFFEVLPTLEQNHAHEFTSSFAYRMYPISCSKALDERVGVFLSAHPDLEFGAKKEILNNRQIRERIRNARSLSESAIQEP